MPLLEVTELQTHYATSRGLLKAVDGVSFTVSAGESVGLVGESGCGKSTLGKAILGLAPVTGGVVRFDSEAVSRLGGGARKPFRRRMQMIFQDPFGSLNPRHSIGDILAAPLAVHGIGKAGERRDSVARILAQVGLPADSIHRYPHEFSGGQRQRIGIARALILDPDLVICDEPVSALDLSIQAQIINLLVSLKGEFGLSFLFISHDLSVVRYFSDRVLVMYLGVIVESATAGQLWSRPLHPYTRALIAAVPDPARRRQAAPLDGDLPGPQDVPVGCRFHPRCPLASDRCRVEAPLPRTWAPGHDVACHHADEALRAGAQP
ncbi:MAG: ATP-binding cassette domain-containing protein [Hyphomicrobiales bacterium]|nr:ATP-binding cassette domain-containing protein [Hyphomicrobiales bacterium]